MGYVVIVLAAGQGKRMKAGRNKQFIEFNGRPLIVHTLHVFQHDEACHSIVLVGNEKEIDHLSQIVDDYRLTKVSTVIPGGSERQYSVYNGIKALSRDQDIVLIHDGARPFITEAAIHRLVKETEISGAAILAVPVKDTIKKIEQGHVKETVDRQSLWAVQTPQAFRLSIIEQAHEKAKKDGVLGTDDASLVERIKIPIAIVQGDYDNIKLTTREDLYFARAIMEKRREEMK